jgi:hypothetical protein
VGRLVLLLHLRPVDRLLLLERLGGHVLAAHPLRVGGGDVHRDLLDEVLEVVGARHEVRLAVDLDEHADAAAHVDVAADDALRRGASGALGGLGEAALAQQRHRLVQIARRPR